MESYSSDSDAASPTDSSSNSSRKSKAWSRLDLLQKLKPEAEKTNTLILQLLEIGNDKMFQEAGLRITTESLLEKQKRYEGYGLEEGTAPAGDFSKFTFEEQLLSEMLRSDLKKLQKKFPKTHSKRGSFYSSPLHAARSPFRQELEVGRASPLTSSLASPLTPPKANSVISENSSRFNDLFFGCLRTYLRRVLEMNAIDTNETSDQILCGYAYRNPPIYFTNAPGAVTISHGNPSVATWTFKGKTYHAITQRSVGSVDRIPPGFYETTKRKRFEHFRQTVRMPLYESQVRSSINQTTEEIDLVIKTRNVPALLDSLEVDFGADMYLVAGNFPIACTAVDIYNLVTAKDPRTLRTHIGRFLHEYIAQYNSSIVFANNYDPDAECDAILSEIIYEYLAQNDSWAQISESLIQQRLLEIYSSQSYIDADTLAFEETVSSSPLFNAEIEAEYTKYISDYPPGLIFHQAKCVDVPSYDNKTTYAGLLTKCLRPILFLTDLGKYALFFKSQMRTHQYVLSQFYDYTGGQLINFFPELVMKRLHLEIDEKTFLEAKKNLDELLKDKVDSTFKRLAASVIENMRVNDISRQETERRVLRSSGSFSSASSLNSSICESTCVCDRLIDVFVRERFITTPLYQSDAFDNMWRPIIIPVLESLRQDRRVRSQDLSSFAPTILSTGVVSLPLDEGNTVEILDEEAVLKLYGKYVIASGYNGTETTIGYFLLDDIVEDIITGVSDTRPPDEMLERFKRKMHNCIVSFKFQHDKKKDVAGKETKKRARNEPEEPSTSTQNHLVQAYVSSLGEEKKSVGSWGVILQSSSGQLLGKYRGGLQSTTFKMMQRAPLKKLSQWIASLSENDASSYRMIEVNLDPRIAPQGDELATLVADLVDVASLRGISMTIKPSPENQHLTKVRQMVESALSRLQAKRLRSS